MGVITLDLDIQGFLTQVNCHVINAPTSYNLLLGRPWLHRYKVVASTAHQCFKFDQNGELRRIMADTRPFAVTESFYSDSQYYILAPDSDEPRTNEETISRPRREIVTQEKEEPRFVVDSQITPELREELMRELAEMALEEEELGNTQTQFKFQAKPQPQEASTSWFYIQDDALVKSSTAPSRFYVDSRALPSRGRRRMQGRGRARGPNGQFFVPDDDGHDQLGASTNSRFYVVPPPRYESRFEIDEDCLRRARQEEAFGGFQEAQEGNEWEIDEEKLQALFVDFHWPLTRLEGLTFVYDKPPEFVVPKPLKPTIFWQCGRVYGDPPQSESLPRQELRAADFRKYSPECRRLIDLQGFYPDEPHLSGYGSHIPDPLSERPQGYRKPGNNLGLGGEDIDQSSDEEYASTYSIIGIEQAPSDPPPANHRMTSRWWPSNGWSGVSRLYIR